MGGSTITDPLPPPALTFRHPVAVVAWRDLAAVTETARATTTTVGVAARPLPAAVLACDCCALGMPLRARHRTGFPSVGTDRATA